MAACDKSPYKNVFKYLQNSQYLARAHKKIAYNDFYPANKRSRSIRFPKQHLKRVKNSNLTRYLYENFQNFISVCCFYQNLKKITRGFDGRVCSLNWPIGVRVILWLCYNEIWCPIFLANFRYFVGHLGLKIQNFNKYQLFPIYYDFSLFSKVGSLWLSQRKFREYKGKNNVLKL
jgi:hypothetical protein